MTRKSLTKKVGIKNAQRALPFILGGVALGGTAWLLARNWGKLTELVQKFYPLADAKDQANGHTQALEGKPYPVEHTSKKYSKNHAHFKDVQKITTV